MVITDIEDSIRINVGVDLTQYSDDERVPLTKAELLKIIEEVWDEGRHSAFSESE